MGNVSGYLELCLAQACPPAVGRLVLLCHIVRQLHQEERHLRPPPCLAPVRYQGSQQRGILSCPSRIILSLVPYRCLHFPVTHRVNHAIVQSGTGMPQVGQTLLVRFCLGTVESDLVFPHPGQFHFVVIPLQLIHLVTHDFSIAVQCRQLQGHVVHTFHQYACRNIILARRSEIRRRTYESAVHEHRVTIGHAPHIEFRMPSHHGRRKTEVLPVPYASLYPDTRLAPSARHVH